MLNLQLAPRILLREAFLTPVTSIRFRAIQVLRDQLLVKSRHVRIYDGGYVAKRPKQPQRADISLASCFCKCTPLLQSSVLLQEHACYVSIAKPRRNRGDAIHASFIIRRLLLQADEYTVWRDYRSLPPSIAQLWRDERERQESFIEVTRLRRQVRHPQIWACMSSYTEE